MPKADLQATQARFAAALDALVGQVKHDKVDPRGDSLRQSVARRRVGEIGHRSDARHRGRQEDRARPTSPLYADGVNVHAISMPRADIPQDGRRRRSQLVHPLAARQGPVALHARRHDRRALRAACPRSARATPSCNCCAPRTHALPCVDKAHKWLVTRGDLDYTALWILYAATPLAEIEVISRPAARRSRSDPAGLDAQSGVLQDHLHRSAEPAEDRDRVVDAALGAVDRYVADRATALFAPILDHLRDVGDVRSAREIEDSLHPSPRTSAA